MNYSDVYLESYDTYLESCKKDDAATDELKPGVMPFNACDGKTEIHPEEVNHPARYIHNGIETIDVIKAWTEGCDGVYAFCMGNAIKYISRWQEKGGIEDLKKAIWYLQWVVDNG